MDRYNFSENEYSDEDEEFYFFDSIKPQKQKDGEENKQNEIEARMVSSITTRFTDLNDFNMIKVDECELNKQYLKEYLQSLFDLTLKLKKNRNTGGPADSVNALKEDGSTLDKINKEKAENRHFKKLQEAIFKKIESSLFKEYSKSSNPFYLNLFFIENSNDFKSNKFTSVACLIAKAFDKWVSQEENYDFVKKFHITPGIKIDAFSVATRHNLLLLDWIARAYQLNHNIEFIIPYLKYKTKNFDFKDKAIIISTLHLHDHFSCEEIVLPLLFQDKLNIIDKYLNKSSKQQQLFVKILDQMCDKNSSISSFLYMYPIKDVKIDKLNRKNLSKLAIRMIKMYSIDPTFCPNITNQKFFKNLRYLMYRRYIEKSISHAPWQDLISECLEQADYLIEGFFGMLNDHMDFKEMDLWIKKLNLDPEKLPDYIHSSLKDYKKKDHKEDSWIDDNTVSNQFYQMKLDESKIKLIDTIKDFHDFLIEIELLSQEKEFLFVGVDTEWKPTCVMGINIEESKKVALFQIATNEHIYLIDLCALSDTFDENDSHLMAHKFLNNRKIIKLGYGFTHDIKMLSHSFINMNDLENFRSTVIDLAFVADQLKKMNLPLFSKVNIQETDEKVTNEKGLSELVKVCLGKPLNKAEQISNWEKRPLRKSQIQYAALDAFCLIEIFDFLNERTREMNIEFDFLKCIGKKYKHGGSSTKIEKAEKKIQMPQQSKIEPSNYVINEHKIRVKDIKFICDNMLGGLGRELRRLGIDTIILKNESDHSDVAKIARRENRYAISSGLPFNIIRNQLPEGKCIHAINKSAKEQAAHILNIFNIEVKVKDFFSRCFRCNAGSFTILNKEQIKSLWFLEKSKQNSEKTFDNQYDYLKDKDLMSKVDIENFCLQTPARPIIDLNQLFESTIKVMDTYFICDGCGQIYWEGPHWQNIKSRFAYAINSNN